MNICTWLLIDILKISDFFIHLMILDIKKMHFFQQKADFEHVNIWFSTKGHVQICVIFSFTKWFWNFKIMLRKFFAKSKIHNFLIIQAKKHLIDRSIVSFENLAIWSRLGGVHDCITSCIVLGQVSPPLNSLTSVYLDFV